jgi:hypothetical protein
LRFCRIAAFLVERAKEHFGSIPKPQRLRLLTAGKERIARVSASFPRACPWFCRPRQGAEIKRLFECGGRPQIANEVNRSSATSPGKGFAQACDDLGVAQRWLVYPGTERYPLRHGAQAVGVVELAGLLGAL